MPPDGIAQAMRRSLTTLAQKALAGTLAGLAVLFGISWMIAGPYGLLFASALCFGVFGLAQAGGATRGLPAVSLRPPRDRIAAWLDKRMAASLDGPARCCAMLVEIDRFKELEERLERTELEDLLWQCETRLRLAVRQDDNALRLEGPVFALVLAPSTALGVEPALQLAARVQAALSVPLTVQGQRVSIKASVGFFLTDRANYRSGHDSLRCARTALNDAQRVGAGSIRSYSDAMRTRQSSRSSFLQDVMRAMDDQQIVAHFQPQVSTLDDRLTGVEALARWIHPDRGFISPGDFLPALQEAGMMRRLAQTMLDQSFEALRDWDSAGLTVPCVGVNFSGEELGAPDLVPQIEAQLADFGLTPDRLAVEVLETVVAGHGDDVIVRNLDRLAQLGCKLDLDDFGTGHASITSIRRLSIGRLKIDRSFVTDIDTDEEQQKMVSAILTMAERLGLDALAEGVESMDERAMLTQLGCTHVQGFGIGRPMPADSLADWVRKHEAGKKQPLSLTGKKSASGL